MGDIVNKQLTEEQCAFLLKQGIPLSMTFDATGMKKADYQNVMRESNLLVAYNVTPCKAEGHTLRTLYGHCIQCNTHALSFIQRFSERGMIYVMYSPELNRSKLGVCIDIDERLRTLRSHHYGGVSDWDIIMCKSASEVGRLEYEISKKLIKLKSNVDYLRGGKTIRCQEIYDCQPNFIVDIVQNMISTLNSSQLN